MRSIISETQKMLEYNGIMDAYLNGEDTDIEWVNEEGNLTEAGMVVLSIMASTEEKVKAGYKRMKADILNAMEQNNIKGFDSDYVRVTYVAPTEREQFDKTKLRDENQELYDKYVSFTPVSASVRVKVK